MTSKEYQTCLRHACDAYLRRQLQSSQVFSAQIVELTKLAVETGLPAEEILPAKSAEFTRLKQQTDALVERENSGSKLH